MENNSIDDLFKKGLSEFERKPSSEAWKKLDQQRGTTRTLGWVWYTAASVAVALITGYLLLQGDQAGLRQPVADYTDSKPVKGQELPTVPEKEVLPDLTKNQVAMKETRDQKGKPAEFNQSRLREADETLPVEEHEADDEIARISLPAEAFTLPEIAKAENDTNAPVVETGATQQEKMAVNRTIVVNVSATDTMAEPRMSRFARVFRQLKNARAGERVDWEEVGINPRHVLARAEAKLKQ